jgi:hypothetical protein
MTDAEFIDRLRSSANKLVNYVSDRVEALTRERDRLREDLEELDFLRHEGGPDSVAAMEVELKRMRSVLRDIETASVCSVSRHVAAAALKKEKQE